jgi:hypothetical protein
MDLKTQPRRRIALLFVRALGKSSLGLANFQARARELGGTLAPDAPSGPALDFTAPLPATDTR